MKGMPRGSALALVWAPMVRAALALLLAAPLAHAAPRAAAPGDGLRPRDGLFLASAPRQQQPAADELGLKLRRTPPRVGSGAVPFPSDAFAAEPRHDARGAVLPPSSPLVPRSAKRPAYYANAPPRSRR
jgi:hypothetical protein